MVPCIWALQGSCDSLELGEGGHPESLVAAPCFLAGFFKLQGGCYYLPMFEAWYKFYSTYLSLPLCSEAFFSSKSI